MADTLQNNVLKRKMTNRKCGEIYCHSPTEFVIYCEFCGLESSEYELFLLHLKLRHSDNVFPQKKEIGDNVSYFDTSVKLEVGIDVQNSDESFVAKISKSTKKHKQKVRDKSPVNSEESDLSNSDSWTPSTEREVSDECEENAELQTKKTKNERTCKHCGIIYKNKVDLENHISLEHEANDVPSSSSSLPVKCMECSEEFPNQHLLNRHSVNEHKGIQCSYCYRKYKCKSNLLRHTAEKHTFRKDAKFVCDYENCGKTFYSRKNLDYHKRSHKQPTTYVCDVCGHIYGSKNTLNRHSYTHSGERPHTCDVCDAKFKLKQQLDRHMDVHTRTNERSFVCSFENCTKSFYTGYRLEVHMRLHTAPKKYVCDVCGYSTKHKQSLQFHYRQHTAENTMS